MPAVPPLQSEANSSLHCPSKSIYFQPPASHEEAHAATDHVASPSSLFLSEKKNTEALCLGEKSLTLLFQNMLLILMELIENGSSHIGTLLC